MNDLYTSPAFESIRAPGNLPPRTAPASPGLENCIQKRGADPPLTSLGYRRLSHTRKGRVSAVTAGVRSGHRVSKRRRCGCIASSWPPPGAEGPYTVAGRPKKNGTWVTVSLVFLFGSSIGDFTCCVSWATPASAMSEIARITHPANGTGKRTWVHSLFRRCVLPRAPPYTKTN